MMGVVMKKLQIEIINRHHKKFVKASKHYIGRGSPLGNPYSHIGGTKAEYQVATRDEAVDKYKVWLEEKIQEGDPRVMRELFKLAELAMHDSICLECFCFPLRCHGEVIKEKLIEAIIESYPGKFRV